MKENLAAALFGCGKVLFFASVGYSRNVDDFAGLRIEIGIHRFFDGTHHFKLCLVGKLRHQSFALVANSVFTGKLASKLVYFGIELSLEGGIFSSH